MGAIRSLLRLNRRTTAPALPSNQNEINLYYSNYKMFYGDPQMGDASFFDVFNPPTYIQNYNGGTGYNGNTAPNVYFPGVYNFVSAGSNWPESQGTVFVNKSPVRTIVQFNGASGKTYVRIGNDADTAWLTGWTESSMAGHTHTYAQIPGLAADLAAAGVGSPVEYVLTATSPFAGGMSVWLSGKRATLVGGVSRSSGFANVFTTISTLPAAVRPVSQVLLPGNKMFGTTVDYQGLVNTDGTLQVRQSAANSNAMSLGGYSWLVP